MTRSNAADRNAPLTHATVRKIVHYVGSTRVRYADIALPRLSFLEPAAC